MRGVSMSKGDLGVRCPRCNSADVYADKKGFSAGAAAAGWLLVGPIGGLLGAAGSNTIRITCLACGEVFHPGKTSADLRKEERAAKNDEQAARGCCGCFLAAIAIAATPIVVLVLAEVATCKPTRTKPSDQNQELVESQPELSSEANAEQPSNVEQPFWPVEPTNSPTDSAELRATVLPDGYRTWKDATGKYTVNAKLLGVKEGKVALRKTDGLTVVLPIQRLSDVDRQYVVDYVQADKSE